MFIGNKEIGLDFPTYFIAEIGSNFDGDLERAKSLIWLAKEHGADAAKFQHYTADTLVSDYEFRRIKNTSHQSGWRKSVYEVYRRAELNIEWTEALAAEAQKANIDFFTSPYAYYLADYVQSFIPAFKIGSGDITWIDYIKYVASMGKPIILATGASTHAEVDDAVNAVLGISKELVLMQCNTNYTASPDNAKYINLRVLSTYANLYPDVVLGLSDHSVGVTSILGAITLGARVIERHFTDDASRVGPDHPFSTDARSWSNMILHARELEEMLGDGVKRVEENEKEARIVQRRSVCARSHFQAGHILGAEDLDYLRPCTDEAMSPEEAKSLIGKRLVEDVQKGQSLLKSMLTD